MATFNVTIGSYTNLPPTQIGDNTIEIGYNDTHVFTVANFTTETIPLYSDPEGDTLETLKILSIPATGSLVLDPGAVPVIVNDIITVADLVAGNLQYIADIATTTAYNENFTFDVTDLGSSTLSGLVGTITMSVAAEANKPPSVVGDGSATINYGETLVFTAAMFTTGTAPVYSDPEGDNPAQLKITALPTLGVIYFNSIPVVVNQIIDLSDVDLSLLTYVPDNADTDGDLQGFQFGVSDTGTGIFVF